MKVPLLDLKAQFAPIRDDVVKAIEAVMESQQFINGPQVRQFEEMVAAYCGCKAAVGVSSGTDAILCALMTLGIGPGDEVITTPYTFFATAGCIARVCAKPVFVDIDPRTFNIDAAKIEAAITNKTKAIMPVHLFGQMADMDPIMEIANRYSLRVIEDAAQAIGATYKGRKAGSIGTVGCFSFFPSKNLGCMGDGGMITTQDAALAQRMAFFRNHGDTAKYHHTWVGGNFRLDTLQAAVLIVKLPHLEEWSARRRANAARYNQLLGGRPNVMTPFIADFAQTIFNQYVIRVPGSTSLTVNRRDELQAFLKENGIGTAVYYPVSLHEQECFSNGGGGACGSADAPGTAGARTTCQRGLGYKKGDFPNSESAAAQTLALPIYPELTDEQIVYVADKVKEFVDNVQ
jgi:dTDP-4-amino-4,6-dideoxygalactose transaminase